MSPKQRKCQFAMKLKITETGNETSATLNSIAKSKTSTTINHILK